MTALGAVAFLVTALLSVLVTFFAFFPSVVFAVVTICMVTAFLVSPVIAVMPFMALFIMMALGSLFVSVMALVIE